MSQKIKEYETQITMKDIEAFIRENHWITAKTYAEFCPHQYVVKHRLSPRAQKMFLEIVKYIRYYGFDGIYGRMNVKQYLFVGDYYYWTMGDTLPNTIILNRAKISNFDIVDRLDGVKVFKARRKTE